MTRIAVALIFVFQLVVATGCTSRQFVLTDQSAMSRLMSTRYVARLHREIPAPLVAWVESSTIDSRDIYLGENHPDHTVRLRSCRVTADGRVWMNADPTLIEDRWIVID